MLVPMIMPNALSLCFAQASPGETDIIRQDDAPAVGPSGHDWLASSGRAFAGPGGGVGSISCGNDSNVPASSSLLGYDVSAGQQMLQRQRWQPLPDRRPGSSALLPLPARRSRPATARPAVGRTAFGTPPWAVAATPSACQVGLLQLLDVGGAGWAEGQPRQQDPPSRSDPADNAGGVGGELQRLAEEPSSETPSAPHNNPPPPPPSPAPTATASVSSSRVPLLPARPGSARLHLPMRLLEVMRRNAAASASCATSPLGTAPSSAAHSHGVQGQPRGVGSMSESGVQVWRASATDWP